MKKILFIAFVILLTASLTSCVDNEVAEEEDYSTYIPAAVESDPFYFPYCEIAVTKHPERYGTVESCASSYTRNEVGAYEDCLTGSSRDYCQDFIDQGRVMFTECASGAIEEGCW